jgi:diguanylate cyclase (GGDEF)-like protein
VIAHHVSDRELTEMRSTLLVENLRLGEPTADEVSIPLRDASDAVVGTLSWSPQAPGWAALKAAMPTILGAALFQILLVALLFLQGNRHLSALRKQAMVDSLSGLPNRRMLRRELEAHLENGEQVALAMFDLDGFKGINDNFGHQVGDRLIKVLSEQFTEFVGKEGMVARLGGDEFAVLVAGKNVVSRINAVTTKTLARFTQPFRLDERTVTVGVSIGLASGGLSHFDAGELMRRADVAMYSAKRAGKMRSCWFDEMLDQLQAKAHGIESELRTALENDEFSLVYQPAFAADGKQIRSVETLLRWSNPVRGMVPASEFIPVAEETGLIDRIGQWVIRKACEDAQHWLDVQLAINVSPAQLRNPDFATRLSYILGDTGFPADRLELEITERYLIRDPEIAAKVMEEIRALGVRITLDEYGTGFSSIGFLRRFAFSKIKLDQNVVKEAESSEAVRMVLQSSVAVGRALDMSVVAGGVETAHQADLMRVIGCDQMQGWYFSQTQSADEITRQIRASQDDGKIVRLWSV